MIRFYQKSLKDILIENKNLKEKLNRKNEKNMNKNLNITSLKLKDLTNEFNSKNQGSTQYESKFSNLSNNKNSFLDRNQSSFLGVNSFNLKSLLNLNLSQNYPSRLRKVFSITKIQNKSNKMRIKSPNKVYLNHITAFETPPFVPK